MTNVRRSAWLVGIVLQLAACGGGSAARESETTTPATTEAPPPAETPTEETPPAETAPAANAPRVRVIDASDAEAASTISVALDGDSESFASGIQYGHASAYAPVEAGRHSVVVHGPEDESGMAPTIALAEDVLENEHAYTVFFVTQGAADAPFALYTSDDEDRPGEDTAAFRFFHAVQGANHVDVCVPGAGRGAATPLFADVVPNSVGTADTQHYADVDVGAVTIQIRAHSSNVCSGRVVGVAHFTSVGGTAYTGVAIGHTTGRGGLQMMVCRDAPGADGSCETVPVSAR